MIALLDGGNGKEYYEVILGVSKEVPADTIPDDFINNLFKSDIAGEVDRWVITQALVSLAEKLKTHPDTQLFINISAQSFSDPDFLPWLSSLLKQSQLPANSLIFQFREIDAVRYLKQAAAICEEMKKSRPGWNNQFWAGYQSTKNPGESRCRLYQSGSPDCGKTAKGRSGKSGFRT